MQGRQRGGRNGGPDSLWLRCCATGSWLAEWPGQTQCMRIIADGSSSGAIALVFPDVSKSGDHLGINQHMFREH